MTKKDNRGLGQSEQVGVKQLGVTSIRAERGAREKAGGVDKGQVVVGPGVFQSFLPSLY